MSSDQNEYAYAKEFIGSLRTASQPVPVRVDTRLRLRMGINASEVEEHRDHADDAPPRYIIGIGASLPPSDRTYSSAVGRHFFTW